MGAGLSERRPSGASRQAQEIANRAVLFDRVTQRRFGVHLIPVAPADLFFGDVSAGFKVRKDLGGRALGNPYQRGQIPNAHGGVFGDRDEHVAVIAQKRPA